MILVLNKKIIDGLVYALKGTLDYKGACATDLESGKRLPLDDESKVEIDVRSEDFFDCHMVTYVLMNLIKDGKVDFNCGNENKDYMYLLKLLGNDYRE